MSGTIRNNFRNPNKSRSRDLLEKLQKPVIGLVFLFGLVWGSLWLGNDVALSPEPYLAIVVGIIPVLACVWVILRSRTPDQRFLLRLFVAALFVRYILAYFIYTRHLQGYLGADADTYDFFGNALLQSWKGLVDPNAPWLVRLTGTRTSGFGMYYWVAAIYYLIGQNPVAIQLINCALGASVCIAGYKITMLAYPNERVARTVAVMTAFSPSLVLWTSQGLKDGPIVLCLCLCVLYTMKVRTKLEVSSFIILVASLLGLYALRHYAAYIMLTATAGALLFTSGKRFTPVRMLQGAVLVILIGLSFSYFGAGEAATALDMKVIQNARVWGAAAANTGFGGDVDITDPKAAIGYLPLGILYVLLSPFPWMINNLKQLITLPELIAWWCLMPMMVKGYWFAFRNRLQQSFVICTLVLGLTLAFALYESNAGTAYRHRAQIYVFFFIFISIGLEMRRQAKLQRRSRAVPGSPSFSPLPVSGSTVGISRATIDPRMS